jgi:hypothetical protein
MDLPATCLTQCLVGSYVSNPKMRHWFGSLAGPSRLDPLWLCSRLVYASADFNIFNFLQFPSLLVVHMSTAISHAIRAESRLCDSCALFGADYSETYNAWINSPSRWDTYFYISYNRTDFEPGFPNLTGSGEVGCQLCRAIKMTRGFEGKPAMFPWNRKKGNQDGNRTFESRSANGNFKVRIKGGFKIHTSVITQAHVQPTLNFAMCIFLKLHSSAGYSNREFEILGTSQGMQRYAALISVKF